MEERDGETSEPEAGDAPESSKPARAFSGAYVIAMGVAFIIVLLGSIWRCG